MHLLLIVVFVIVFAKPLRYLLQAAIALVLYVAFMWLAFLAGVALFAGLGVLTVLAAIVTLPLDTYRRLRGAR